VSASGVQRSVAEPQEVAERARHDADDVVLLAVEDDRLTDDGRLAAELPLPEAVASTTTLFLPGSILLGRERRPRIGATPRVSKMSRTRGSPEVAAARAVTGERGPQPVNTKTPSNSEVFSRRSRNPGPDAPASRLLRDG
jgi:hypothetical protein